MTRGRKRKTGRRYANGRLRLSPEARIVRGNDRAMAAAARYGQDHADAIGRAYRAGLLGEGSQAKARLDTARALASAYRATFTVGAVRCAIGGSVATADARILPAEPRTAQKRHEWLLGSLNRIKALPRGCERHFRQLVLEDHPDGGPAWLDRLLLALAHAERLPANARRVEQGPDGHAMRLALTAIDAC